MSQGSNKRKRMACIHAYRLSQTGFTTREIATATGYAAGAIAEMVKVGERFADDPALDTIKLKRKNTHTGSSDE